jgi:general L-amino acid transport system permease protein
MGPPEPPGLLKWLQDNLFNSWFNGILTFFALYVIYVVIRGSISWIFFTADWRPITLSPLLFLVGQYPREELWRIGINLTLISFMIGMSWGVWRGIMRSFALLFAAGLAVLSLFPDQSGTFTLFHRGMLLANLSIIGLGYLLGKQDFVKGHHAMLGWFLATTITAVLTRGFDNWDLIPGVGTGAWGGLMVTLLLAVGGILLSFPIGVILALGRRSSLPVLSLFCTLFIETVRGVPLVSILFMSSIILALFLPAEIRIDRLIRALLGMTLFSAAYTAENVRGGLQSIPQGQIDAAKAVGFNNFQTTILIVLPQALRAVIPAIVGQFISLFKDTTLAVIVAINELLNIGKSILQSDPEFIGLQAEMYIFIAVIFWILSYLMSFASRRLEAALGVGER